MKHCAAAVSIVLLLVSLFATGEALKTFGRSAGDTAFLFEDKLATATATRPEGAPAGPTSTFSREKVFYTATAADGVTELLVTLTPTSMHAVNMTPGSGRAMVWQNRLAVVHSTLLEDGNDVLVTLNAYHHHHKNNRHRQDDDATPSRPRRQRRSNADSGLLARVRLSDGRIMWRSRANSGDLFSTIQIHNNRAYIINIDSEIHKASLVSVDATTGALLATQKMETVFQHSAELIVCGKILASFVDGVTIGGYNLDTLRVEWTRRGEWSEERFFCQQEEHGSRQPSLVVAVGAATSAVSGSKPEEDLRVLVLDPTDGKQLASNTIRHHSTGSLWSSTHLHNLLVAYNGTDLRAVNTATAQRFNNKQAASQMMPGNTEWSIRFGRSRLEATHRIAAAPTMCGDSVLFIPFEVTKRSTAASTTTSRFEMVAVDVKAGKVLYRVPVRTMTQSDEQAITMMLPPSCMAPQQDDDQNVFRVVTGVYKVDTAPHDEESSAATSQNQMEVFGFYAGSD